MSAATQIAHDLAEKLPASLQAYVPESIKVRLPIFDAR